MAISHAQCEHPATPAARAICRKNQEKLAAGKITSTPQVKQLQYQLSQNYREQLLSLAGLTTTEVKELIQEVDVADIDKWFKATMPDLMKVIEANHQDASLLTVSYLREHAALQGFKAGAVPAKVIREQLMKSLEVTGPVAFKTHIAAGGTTASATKVMQTTLSGSSERLAMAGARDTLDAAVANPNSDVLGYHRRTSSSPCDYCAGLSKEAVYDNNTFHAHDHCTCTGEPLYLDTQYMATHPMDVVQLEDDIYKGGFATGNYLLGSNPLAAEDEVTQLVRAFKTSRERDDEIAERLAEMFRLTGKKMPDLILSPPADKGKIDRFPGVVQKLAAKLKAETMKNPLFEIEDIPGYRGMTIEERKAATALLKDGRFAVDKGGLRNIKDKRILLVDDVVTSGEQAQQLRAALLKAGAKEVDFIAIAKAPSIQEVAQAAKVTAESFDAEFKALVQELKENARKGHSYEAAIDGLHGTDALNKLRREYLQTHTMSREDFEFYSDTLDALQWYVDFGYDPMNKYLRLGIVNDRDVIQHARALLKWFDSDKVTTLKQDTAVYRGIKDGQLVFGSRWADNLEGVEFTDKGLYSVTTTRDTALNFAHPQYPRHAIIRIIVPKGHKALKGNDSETEIILKPGTKFRVIRDYQGKPSRHIDLEIIEDD